MSVGSQNACANHSIIRDTTIILLDRITDAERMKYTLETLQK